MTPELARETGNWPSIVWAAINLVEVTAASFKLTKDCVLTGVATGVG